MLNLIAQLDEFKGNWKLLGKISPEKLRGLKKVATIESVGSSNRIEGNRLSNQEVEALLSQVGRASFANRDEEEVAGYARLMETIFESWEWIPLTENHIKQLHQILLGYSAKDEKHKGEYKKIANAIATYDQKGKALGVVFEPATPFETPFKMQELIRWTNQNLADSFHHPLIVIGVFVVRFLAIHPFQDGNGRLSRALTNLLLLKSGYAYVPYSSMESIIEENKEAYYRALRETQITLNTTPNYEPWLMFFFQTLHKQKTRLEHQLERVETQPLPHLDLPEVSAKIMAVFETHNRATISELAQLTGANVNTLKKHLARLVGQNRLIQHGKTRGVWYTQA